MLDAAVFVVTRRGEPAFLEARTRRALGALGERARAVDVDALGCALATSARAFVVRAGAYGFALRAPPPSATGKALVAVGALRGDPSWAALLHDTGGVVDGGVALPSIAVLYTEAPAALAAALARAGTLEAAVADLARGGRHRVLRIADFDAALGVRLRVLELVTSLHRGGAERVALDLARGLDAHGIDATLGVLDAPRRASYAAPPGARLFHVEARTRDERVARAAHAAIAEGFDVVHAHLLDARELARLRQSGAAVVTTLHNARCGLPPGMAAVDASAADLVLACSRGVLADAPDVRAPARVVWNGIATSERAPAGPHARAAIRAELGIASDALVLLAVANPRAQKRLDRAVHVLGEVRQRGRDAHLVVAGAPLLINEDAQRAHDSMVAAAAALGVTRWLHAVGSREDVPALHAAADVVLSTSAWEGLSLAHLEALAAGVPLVATRVHGTDEIARKHGGVHLVDVDASPAAFADAIEGALADPARPALAPDFTVRAMAARHAWMLPRAVAPRPDPAGPILIVTNNLSTGGAQTSARRLLAGLRARGVPAACVVVEEQPAFPTPGRAAAIADGVEVFATRSLRTTRLPAVAAEVLAIVDRERPRAVFFWNLVAELRVLVAEALLHTPVFDVSPGAMSYASLERYLAAPRAGHPVLDERDYGRLLAGVVAKYEGERARAARLGAPVFVIPNGLPVPSDPAPLPPARERLVVGTLARLAPDKKLEQLLDALACIDADVANAIEVQIAGGPEPGGDDYVAALRARASTLAVPVHFVGDVAAAPFLEGLDVFAMIAEPAGCPNAILEAMAAARPVVTTDVGGARELVDDGETGLVVPPADPAAFAGALSHLVTDRACRARMGAAGHARARAAFSVERMVSDYLATVATG